LLTDPFLLGLKGDAVVQVAPEFESCRAVAEQSGQPLRAIYAAANRAWTRPEPR